jgi:predicted transcriptional regulator
VAQQTHLSQSTIADLEKPRANPRLDTLERVGWALGMDGLALHALAKRLAQQRQRACSTLP